MPNDGFLASDFEHAGRLLRSRRGGDIGAVMSNNFNIILAALDRAARVTDEMVENEKLAQSLEVLRLGTKIGGHKYNVLTEAAERLRACAALEAALPLVGEPVEVKPLVWSNYLSKAMADLAGARATALREAAEIARSIEEKQDRDYGSANTGGAAEVAAAILAHAGTEKGTAASALSRLSATVEQVSREQDEARENVLGLSNEISAISFDVEHDDDSYNEGFSDGQSEAEGAAADLFRAMVRWLERHRALSDSDDTLSAQDIIEALAEVERENKRLETTVRREAAARQAAEARVGALEEALLPFAGYAVSSIGMDLDGYVIKLASVNAQQPAFADFERARRALTQQEPKNG